MGLKVVPATITEVIEFNPKLRAVRFVPENEALADYRPGDFLYIRVPASQEESDSTVKSLSDKTEIRAYSLSSSPTQPFYEITIVEKDREPHVSKLLQQIDSGRDLIEISSKDWVRHGKITLYDAEIDGGKLLFIGGGTGIAPFIGMVRYIKDKNLDADVWLLGSFRSTEHLIFHEELLDITKRLPNIKYYPTLTRYANDDWNWGRGRFVIRDKDDIIVRNDFPDIVGGIQQYTAYVCGLKAMLNDTQEALSGAGVKLIKKEAWD
ncbi:MAG: hypothetical protein HYY55_00520 [Candidatus Niyogibacteria bacterium]|nr:MAG: hypothetical protein HYY55_00520 [Candidatus Niyogibacteria bacterium]